MKTVVHFKPNGAVEVVDGLSASGATAWGSWPNVVKALVAGGWGGGLSPNEYVSTLEIDTYGISLTFAKLPTEDR